MTGLEKFEKKNEYFTLSSNWRHISGRKWPIPNIYNFLYLKRIIRQFTRIERDNDVTSGIQKGLCLKKY